MGFYSEYVSKRGDIAKQFYDSWSINRNKYEYKDAGFIALPIATIKPINLDGVLSGFPIARKISPRTISSDIQSIKPNDVNRKQTKRKNN